MRRISRFLSDVAEFGGMFFKTAFEHPDFDAISFIAHQEDLYTQKLINHNRTLNVLKNMNEMETKEQIVQLEETYQKLSTEICELENEIEAQLLKSHNAEKQADKDLHMRSALIMLNKQQRKKIKIDAAKENMDICTVLETNKSNLEQVAKVNRDVMSNTIFDADAIRIEGNTVKEIFENHTRVAIATSDVLKNIKTGAKEVAYYNNGRDVRMLTAPISTTESNQRQLEERLRDIVERQGRSHGRSKAEVPGRQDIQNHTQPSAEPVS
ncbi:ORF81 [Ranid herpesvirus 2]|uniref:ORF81 n=1 Tax=Ranid herpesvirus 2 TaxID=389214 RepID=Q14W25_9VIRU|nr:ORF81 [Ranid herpesvirus 2]ABG25661.1 ORF81 [Ranid herpesvirus 2]